jgi:hypothetical protein
MKEPNWLPVPAILLVVLEVLNQRIRIGTSTVSVTVHAHELGGVTFAGESGR